MAGAFGPRARPGRLSGWLPGPGAGQGVYEGQIGPKITSGRSLATRPGTHRWAPRYAFGPAAGPWEKDGRAVILGLVLLGSRRGTVGRRGFWGAR